MYPAVVFTLALVVMIIVVAFIVPVFVGIFEEIASENPGAPSQLPFMTRITVGISDFITGKWYILIPMIAIVAYVFLRWKKTDRGRLQWDRIKLRLPFHIGDIVREGRPGPLVADVLGHRLLGRADPAGDPDLGRHRRQRGDQGGDGRRLRARSSGAARSRAR